MVEAADNINSDQRNARAREDQFLARLLFGLWPGLHAARNQGRIMAREIETEHETRDPENQPIQPALPVAWRPGGHEDHQRKEELELRKPYKCTLGEIIHREHDRSDIGINAGAWNRERSAEIAAWIVRILLAPLLH